MKLRIVSDGTAIGTHVQDEDGNPVENVTFLLWSMDAEEGQACITMGLKGVPIEVVGELSTEETEKERHDAIDPQGVDAK